jgi:hypothetical protein
MAAGAVALTAAADDAVAVPVDQLCAAELQAGVTALAWQRDRLDGWVSAASGQLQVSTGGRVATYDGGSRSVAGRLAEATGTSATAAGVRLRISAALRQLPLVVQAVLDAVIGQEQAAVLARLVGTIPLAHLLDVQEQLIEVAAGRDPGALAVWVRHLIATHCEPQLEADEAGARDARFLTIRRGTDGSLKGSFILAPAEAEPFLTVLEATARRMGDGDRCPAGQRRADALTDLADQVLRHGDLPEHGGHARPSPTSCLPSGPPGRPAAPPAAAPDPQAPPPDPARQRWPDGPVEAQPAGMLPSAA